MKKASLFIPAAALLALAACNKESEVKAPESEVVKVVNLTLTADRGTDATKTNITYNDNYGSIYSEWRTGDIVSVYSYKDLTKVGELTASNISNESNVPSVNERNTSKATFTGKVTLTETSGAIGDDFIFIYEGAGTQDTDYSFADGVLTYNVGYVTDITEINKWDIAYLKQKIQGEAGVENGATVSGTFTNKMGFGYFSTKDSSVKDMDLDANYYSSFTINVKDGSVVGVPGKVTLPKNEEFYMPLIGGQEVRLGCGKTWGDGTAATDNHTDNEYTEVALEKTFTANAGTYYRLGRVDGFGPVKFKTGDWTVYNTIASSQFNIGTAPTVDLVKFTPGNLQWVGDITEDVNNFYWQLASSQYSYFGSGNATAEEDGYIKKGKVDLFGWGENAAPFNTSTDNLQYQKDANAGDELPVYYRWEYNFMKNANIVYETPAADATKNKLYVAGTYNGLGLPLYIDFDTEKTYADAEYTFTLSKDQWVALFANQPWAECAVVLESGETTNGVAIMPYGKTADDMVDLGFKEDKISVACAYADNTIDQEKIDDHGLLFLPAANGSTGVYYWTGSSSRAEGAALMILFSSGKVNIGPGYPRSARYGVRLASRSE